MSNWVNCNGTWTNLNYLRYIYPAPLDKTPGAKWRIEGYTDDDDIIEFLNTDFDNEELAQDYLDEFMKRNEYQIEIED